MDSNPSSSSPGSPTPMHVTIVKAQIILLLTTLTEDNFARNQRQIRSLSEQYGAETYLHFIRRLIVHSQYRLARAAGTLDFSDATSLPFRLLVQETQRLSRNPFLADRFREGIDTGDGDTFRDFNLVRFVDRIGLRPLERFILASAVVSAPVRKEELANQAAKIIRRDYDHAVLALCHQPSFDRADLTPAQIEKLLRNLFSDPPTGNTPILDNQQRRALVIAVQGKYGTAMMAPVLSADISDVD